MLPFNLQKKQYSFFKKKLLLPIFVVLSVSACTAILSTDYDKTVGAKAAKQVSAQMGLYQPLEMQQYVNNVGQRLVKELDNNQFTFQFKIVDDATPNAFALPGGYIYISRGLLALLMNEDELACVLAHEITHVTQRHSVQQMSSNIVPSIIKIPGNIVGLFSDQLGNLINTPINAGNNLFLSRYSRGHETEADTLGITLAAKAGYKPTSMSHILTRLNDTIEFTSQETQEKSYFDSHPYTPDRVKNVQQVSKSLTTVERAPIDLSFPDKLDGLVFEENPANGIFQASLFLQPSMGFTMEFPAQWALYNQPQAVIAMREKEQAFIALSGTGNKYSALENVTKFQEAFKKEYDKELTYKEINFEWGGKGYLITLQDKGQSVLFLWLDFNKTTMQISSVAPHAFKKKLMASALSFKPITQQQIASINEKVLRVVKAKDHEDIKTLKQREHGIEELEYTILINDLNKDQPLKKDQKVKIIKEQPFTDDLLFKKQ
ncbi:peptidase [Psychromonas sp. RZ22]|uniref:M48 family metalloprotease n=1 Tax=Psychromonas algarum TaxID=2555643 RepID=UPI0010679333|nr:M48 family metalloprotease [Psychromonas sp. RZ22]TEW55556.1 peptidase [Psychromonas sp. RZ22]